SRRRWKRLQSPLPGEAREQEAVGGDQGEPVLILLLQQVAPRAVDAEHAGEVEPGAPVLGLAQLPHRRELERGERRTVGKTTRHAELGGGLGRKVCPVGRPGDLLVLERGGEPISLAPCAAIDLVPKRLELPTITKPAIPSLAATHGLPPLGLE